MSLCLCVYKLLSKDSTEGFFDLADGMDGYLIFRGIEALEIVFRNDDIAEAQFLGFGDSLFDTVDGAHLTRETYLTTHAPTCLNRGIDIRREDSGDDAEVHGQVGHPETTCDVDEHVLLDKFETDTLLEDGEEHVETALVETGGRALGRAVGGRGDEGLCLDEEGAHTLDG